MLRVGPVGVLAPICNLRKQEVSDRRKIFYAYPSISQHSPACAFMPRCGKEDASMRRLVHKKVIVNGKIRYVPVWITVKKC